MMLTPQLTAMVHSILSGEETIGLLEAHEMNQSHVLGLQGYKRFHRYRVMDRGRHSLKLQCFLVETYHVEPTINVTFATPSASRPFLDSLKAMHDLSANHLTLIKDTCAIAFESGEHLLGGYLECMMEDQVKELDEYYRLWSDAKRENADLNYLSKELHKKIKCKERKYFGFVSDKKYKY